MMENRFSSFINNIKKIDSQKILTSIKKQQKNINPQVAFEKTVTCVVDKILEGQSVEVATESVRKEIIDQFVVDSRDKKNVIPLVKYANTVLMSNVPKNLKSLKEFRQNIAKTLIKDAKKNLEEKNIVDVQIVTEQSDSHEHKSYKKERSPHHRRQKTNGS